MRSEKSKLTRNGVCRNLDFSPYNFTYFYKDKVITFNFSSKLHLDKFVKLRQNNWSMIYNYLYKRFKFKVDCVLLADCNLYQKIENRGFFVKIGDQVFTDVNKIVLTN